MNVKELIEHYGSVVRTADAFGVSRATVYSWAKNGMPEQTRRAMRIGADITMTKVLNKAICDGKD